MALSQAAKKIDDAMGRAEGTDTTPVSNPSKDQPLPTPSGEKMKALTWQGKNSVQIDECDKPSLVNNHDVILKVTGSTVCGSDRHLYHAAIVGLEKGDILGHEFMGIVDEVGPSVTKVKKGDRVVASFNIGCGTCFMCSQGLSSTCTRTNQSNLQNAMYGNRTCGMFGYSHFTGGFAGGQAEYTRVPHGDANLLVLPRQVTDEDGLYLSDILPTSYNQVVDTNVKQGDVVAIWGAGAIGLSSAKWSFLRGASRVILIDNVQWRLDYAKSKIPEIELLNYDEHKDVAKRLNELTAPGTLDVPNSDTRPAGVDVALECAAGEYAKGWIHKIELAVGLETDTSEIINEMIAAVRPWGSIGITGVYAGYANHINIGAIMEKGVRLIGNGQAPVHRWWKEILNDYLIPGKFKPTDLFVTHRVTLDQVPDVYKKMDSADPDARIIKTFVTTKFSKGLAGPATSKILKGI